MIQLRGVECEKLETLTDFFDIVTLKKKFINFKKVECE